MKKSIRTIFFLAILFTFGFVTNAGAAVVILSETDYGSRVQISEAIQEFLDENGFVKGMESEDITAIITDIQADDELRLEWNTLVTTLLLEAFRKGHDSVYVTMGDWRYRIMTPPEDPLEE